MIGAIVSGQMAHRRNLRRVGWLDPKRRKRRAKAKRRARQRWHTVTWVTTDGRRHRRRFPNRRMADGFARDLRARKWK